MANVPSEADRLLERGRKKILRTCLLWGGPLLAILVLAALQYAGAVRLEESFAAAPNKVEPGVVWLVLAGLGWLPFLCGAIGVLQGWASMRRAKQLRQQPAPSPKRRNRQEIPRPRHFSVRHDGTGLRIRVRWIRRRFATAAGICLFWNSGQVLWYWSALRTPEPRIMWFAMIWGIPFVAIGLLLLYATLAGLLNCTVIKVTPEFLTVWHGPVPWWGNRRLPVNELERLYCAKDTTSEKDRRTRYYCVNALTKGA